MAGKRRRRTRSPRRRQGISATSRQRPPSELARALPNRRGWPRRRRARGGETRVGVRAAARRTSGDAGVSPSSATHAAATPRRAASAAALRTPGTSIAGAARSRRSASERAACAARRSDPAAAARRASCWVSSDSSPRGRLTPPPSASVARGTRPTARATRRIGGASTSASCPRRRAPATRASTPSAESPPPSASARTGFVRVDRGGFLGARPPRLARVRVRGGRLAEEVEIRHRRERLLDRARASAESRGRAARTSATRGGTARLCMCTEASPIAKVRAGRSRGEEDGASATKGAPAPPPASAATTTRRCVLVAGESTRVCGTLGRGLSRSPTDEVPRDAFPIDAPRRASPPSALIDARSPDRGRHARLGAPSRSRLPRRPSRSTRGRRFRAPSFDRPSPPPRALHHGVASAPEALDARSAHEQAPGRRGQRGRGVLNQTRSRRRKATTRTSPSPRSRTSSTRISTTTNPPATPRRWSSRRNAANPR